MARLHLAVGFLAAATTISPSCVFDREDGPHEPPANDLRVALSAERLEAECGADIMDLWVAGDPEVRAQYEASESVFSAKWIEGVGCRAQLGDIESQRVLGIAYRDGADGLPQNYEEAAKMV